MKPPISYYGGKQNLVRHILPLIPPHTIYCEPFFGGGAVYFAKRPAKLSAINDTNDWAITFYRQLKTNFEALNSMIQGTLHSESEYRRAKEILQGKEADSLLIAWAFWVQTNMSFSAKMFAGFAFHNAIVTAKTGKNGKSLGGNVPSPKNQLSKRNRFVGYERALSTTEIFNRDAIEVIKLKDTAQTFFYIDPPYFNSDMGHYSGYSQADFEALLNLLESIEGKFLLSCYPSDMLDEWRYKNGFQTMDIVQTLAVDGRRKESKKKTECLTWNYSLESDKQIELF